jgi:hypothetical protein
MIIKFFDIDWTDARECWEEYRGTDPFDLPSELIVQWDEYKNINDWKFNLDGDKDSMWKELSNVLDDETSFLNNGFSWKVADDDAPEWWKKEN